MSFIKAINATRHKNIFLVNGYGGKKKAWYYVMVDSLKLPLFQRLVDSKSETNLQEYGQTIVSGWGDNPPQILKDKIELYGGGYNSASDVELDAYYKSRTDAVFINATDKGQECYYYLLVNGKIVEEFRRLIAANEQINFEEFGTILDSGWGNPTDIVIKYMEEKYGIRTPVIA